MCKVIDAYIATKTETAAERVVVTADQGLKAQPGMPRPGVEFRGPDEFPVVMRAARHEPGQVFGTDDGGKESARRAVEG